MSDEEYNFSEDHDRHIVLAQEASIEAERIIGEDFKTVSPGVRSFVRAECAMVLAQSRIALFMENQLDKTSLYESRYLIEEALRSMGVLGEFLDKEKSREARQQGSSKKRPRR